jgi:hypothetical protein
MIYRVLIHSNIEIYPKHFLLLATNELQVGRILRDFIGLELPFSVLGTVARMGSAWRGYHPYRLLDMHFLVQTSNDAWVLTKNPSSYELGKHLTFITNEWRDYENQL